MSHACALLLAWTQHGTLRMLSCWSLTPYRALCCPQPASLDRRGFLTVGPAAAAEVLKPGAKQPELPKDAGQASIKRMDDLRFAKGDIRTADIKGNLQRTMQNDAAVFRTQVHTGADQAFSSIGHGE